MRTAVRVFVIFVWAWVPCLRAGVLSVVVDARQPVLSGQAFMPHGAYELVHGRIFFGYDVANHMNSNIVDLALAPRNENGLVEAWSNFTLLQPVDAAKGSGVLLVEVSNRGGKFSPRYFNRATSRQLKADDPKAFGNGLLMRLGLSVLWVGWQADVPRREGILRLHAPVARHPNGSPITGWVRADWTVDQPAKFLEIGHRRHIPYALADSGHADQVLTVREGRDAPRQAIPRDQWRFARVEDERVIPDEGAVYTETGFQAGKIYELVYRAKHPLVIGLGLAVIRDVAAHAKYVENSLFAAKYALAAGVSQTGRFLRHFLYQGFNTDEAGRLAYDGLMIITAGAGRGSFNHRFAQPSRDAHRYSAFFFPTDIFPFTGATQFEPQQWRSDGLLAHQQPDHLPKTFYINTGYEYWGRAASLIHTSVDGHKDVAPPDHERIYHLASGQHFVGRFPPSAEEGGAKVFRGNPLDFSVNYRALLVRLANWVKDGAPPPANAYPRIDQNTLLPLEKVAFPKIPGMTFPQVAHVAYRADYGARWIRGIVDRQPPRLGQPFPTLVAAVDVFGNEEPGVRNLEIRVPLATYTPWHVRRGLAGGNGELTDFLGTFAPLPQTEARKQQSGDPRPSIESLYSSRQAYLSAAEKAAMILVVEGFLLEEDRDHVLAKAAEKWDWIHALD